MAFSSVVRASGAAENCLIEGKNADGKPYYVALSPGWTDEAILNALGLDIRKSKMSRSLGPDGESRTYLLGRKEIHITRSASTGIYVMLYVKDDGTYAEWYLQSCQHNNSAHKSAHG
ncbi:hypothetical protein NX784_26720 [Massilia pinisoli]|uniref:Uncharacterized protein n=1 Tax=Massilia pinisoli TaxID=1772194 RepID=A0ABT2A005_9BURK|nr:hypothetical protein [Massilia pinisoli]MCS0585184.1 hypothetical protein [Massilia pinisoli]